VQVGSSGTSCSATVAGALRYSGGSAYVCDGTNWDVIGGSSGAGSLMLGTSATAPNPYASGSDTETGLYTAGAGKVDVTSAGTQIAEFNAGGLNVVTGKVGIGTASPTHLLDMYSSTSADPMAELSANSGVSFYVHAGSGGGKIFAAGGPSSFLTGTVSGDSGFLYTSGNSFYIGIQNSAPYLSIGTTGNVGIGTTIPAAALQVVGNFQVGTATHYAKFLQQNTTQLGWLTDASIYVQSWDTANGRVSIGAAGTAPLSTLDLLGNLAVGSYGGVNAAPSNGMIVSGSVGIGTTTPNSKLQVYAGEVQVGSSGTSCL